MVGAVALAVPLAACGGALSSDLFTATDAGALGVDAATAKKDAASVVGHPVGSPEASTTAPVDAGHTVIIHDATVAPPPDHDASLPVIVVDAGDGTKDTGTTTTPPTGTVCGATTCTSNKPSCCLEQGQGQGGGSATCIATNGTCQGVVYSCLSNATCNGGICCVKNAGFTSTVSCETSCSGGNEAPICNTANDPCANGEQCMGVGILDYGYCVAGHGGH